MSDESFEIFFRKRNDNTQYRAKVEITYRSDNVIRMTIKAGVKELYMEKWLFRKSHQWKLTGSNFSLGYDHQSNAMLIMSIQDEIDYKLKKEGL